MATPGLYTTATVGVFFVRKKDGTLRIITDTRLANCSFRDPPRTRLPTPGAFTSVELEQGAKLYMTQGDVENAFHQMLLPPELVDIFILPCVEARFLGIKEIDGIAISGRTLVSPRLRTLPP